MILGVAYLLSFENLQGNYFLRFFHTDAWDFGEKYFSLMREILHALRESGRKCLGGRLPLNAGELEALNTWAWYGCNSKHLCTRPHHQTHGKTTFRPKSFCPILVCPKYFCPIWIWPLVLHYVLYNVWPNTFRPKHFSPWPTWFNNLLSKIFSSKIF